jgi:hypothetical protein
MPDIKSSPHCELVLSKPPECGDYRAMRSWVLCKSWQLMDKGRLTRLPVKQAWSEAKGICKKQ